jgi:hypothetical protein
MAKPGVLNLSNWLPQSAMIYFAVTKISFPGSKNGGATK